MRNKNFSAATSRLFSKKSVSLAASAAIENLEPRQLMSTSYAIGIGVNDGSTSFMNAASSKLKSLGVQTVRLWYTTDFSSRSISGVLQRAIDYSNKGFDVMLEVAPQSGNIYSASAIQGWFKWATSNSSLKNAVDRWEIGNEPDHSEYWKGTLSQYVNNLLKPAYETLHAAGETVVSAGPSWDTDDVQTMINAGMLSYTDYVGFHPYASGVAGVEASLAKIKSVVDGRKPLVASEWNVRGLEGNTSAWAAADAAVYADIKSTFAINYYYAAEKSSTPAGPAGIMYSDGSANTLFYNAFSTFKNGGTDSSGGSTDGSSGNTPAGSTGTISGTLWNDTDGDGVKDSNETVSGVRTVFLDTNGNGKLDSGEKSVQSNSSGVYKFTNLASGKYNVTRVFPAGYRISNSSTKDVVVSLSPGQTISTANIGTTDVAVSAPSSATATIAGTLWNDTDSDGVYDSNESVTGVRTVFIDSNGNGQLDSGERSTQSTTAGKFSFANLIAGTYKITRVFPAGFHLSNSSSKDLTFTVAAGQQITNANIGTTD